MFLAKVVFPVPPFGEQITRSRPSVLFTDIRGFSSTSDTQPSLYASTGKQSPFGSALGKRKGKLFTRKIRSLSVLSSWGWLVGQPGADGAGGEYRDLPRKTELPLLRGEAWGVTAGFALICSFCRTPFVHEGVGDRVLQFGLELRLRSVRSSQEISPRRKDRSGEGTPKGTTSRVVL